MRQYSCCIKSNRRILRPGQLPVAASTCLLLFFSIPWFWEQLFLKPVFNMVSAAVPHMVSMAHTSAPAFHRATPVVSQPRKTVATVPVAAPAAPAAGKIAPYDYTVPRSFVPASASVSLFCPPAAHPGDVPAPAGTGGSAPSAALPTTADAQPKRLSGRVPGSFSSSSVPECIVRPLAIPASAGGRTSGDVFMPSATSTRSQPVVVARRQNSQAGCTMTPSANYSPAAVRTVIRQETLQTPKVGGNLCIRRVWPAAPVRESIAPCETLYAPLSTLHTYESLVLPVMTETTTPLMHPHTPRSTATIPAYGTTQAPVRYLPAPAHAHPTTVPSQEAQHYSEEQEVDMTAAVPAPSGKPAITEESHSFGTADLQLPHSDYVAMKAAAAKGAPVALLQTEIDHFCRKKFESLCATRGGRFCTASSIVGRYGPGGANDAGGWRCYNNDEMSMDRRLVGCVDQCGSLMRCLGAPGPNTTSVAAPELEEWVLQRKWQHCSAYQQAADALCNFKTSGDLARYDMLRKRWMCLDLDDIAFEGRSYCVDNCGNPVPCVGGLLPGLVPKYTVHIVQHPDMEKAFEAIQPCSDLNDVCIATVLNPPHCVKQSTTVFMQRFSAQQERLDEECQRDRDDACRRNALQEDCYRLWLARYDIGAQGESQAWRCYPESVLDFSQVSFCTDGCGNLLPCRGAPTSRTALVINVPKAQEIMADPSYCSVYQRAANNFCRHKRGSAFVARQHCNTLKWQCLDKDHLPARGWTNCLGHCGEYTPCPPGVEEFVAVPFSEDPELVRAIMALPAACPPGETCVPTKQAPPFCSLSRPQPSSLYEDVQVGSPIIGWSAWTKHRNDPRGWLSTARPRLAEDFVAKAQHDDVHKKTSVTSSTSRYTRRGGRHLEAPIYSCPVGNLTHREILLQL